MTRGAVLAQHASDGVCHLATIGRRSGRSRIIEIWFATDGEVVYFLAGGRHQAHWVRNILADARVRLRLGGATMTGQARIVVDAGEELQARHLLAAKYQGWTPSKPLSEWAANSLPVAVELDATE
jgi:deazaflavin-dependent oxidoreductase (nitroreductase family)